MSAPPGAELFFYVMVAGFALAATALAYGVALGFWKLHKVSLRIKEIIAMAGLFLLLFYTSSSYLMETEEDVTMGKIGNPTGYEGTLLYYGFPRTMYSRFEPYDPNARSLFTGLSNFFSDGFFTNFTCWAVVSVILVYSLKYVTNKRGHT